MTWSSQRRVARIVESLVCKLESMLNQMKFNIFPCFFAMKWRPTSCKIVPDELKNGVQCCFCNFDSREVI